MTELTHLSATEIDALYAVEQRTDFSPFEKPIGLWYSVDGDWEKWCLSEMPAWLADSYVYRVKLGESRILKITSVSEFEQFHRKYARPAEAYRSIVPDTDFYWTPDWRVVASEYDGIEIAPYRWECRLTTLWYYGFDCASGVLWRPQAGAGVELIGRTKGGNAMKK